MSHVKEAMHTTLIKISYSAAILAALACGSGGTSEGATGSFTPSGDGAPACPTPEAGSASLADQLVGTWTGEDDGLDRSIEITFQLDGKYSYFAVLSPTLTGSGTYSVGVAPARANRPGLKVSIRRRERGTREVNAFPVRCGDGGRCNPRSRLQSHGEPSGLCAARRGRRSRA